MLTAPMGVLPDGDEWIMEPRYRGVRAIAGVPGIAGARRAWFEHGETGERITAVPYLARNVATAFPPGSVVDGIIYELHGEPHWRRVERIVNRAAEHEARPGDPELGFMLLDVLILDGEDLTGAPLRERKLAMLEVWRQLIDQDWWQFANATRRWNLRMVMQYRPQARVVDQLVAQGFDSVVVKHVESRYLPGATNGGWHIVQPRVLTGGVPIDVDVTSAPAVKVPVSRC
jgi:ATP-dependent DNA ligase